MRMRYIFAIDKETNFLSMVMKMTKIVNTSIPL